MNVDFNILENFWTEFLTSKGFKLECACEWADTNAKTLTFIGCKPQLYVFVGLGKQRLDTKSGGFVAVDFKKSFNKISECPILFDTTVSHDLLWKAIEMLMSAGMKFSENFGKIAYTGTGLQCDPDISKLRKENVVKRMKNSKNMLH